MSDKDKRVEISDAVSGMTGASVVEFDPRLRFSTSASRLAMEGEMARGLDGPASGSGTSGFDGR